MENTKGLSDLCVYLLLATETTEKNVDAAQ